MAEKEKEKTKPKVLPVADPTKIEKFTKGGKLKTKKWYLYHFSSSEMQWSNEFFSDMENWANCENCKFFELRNGTQTCHKFDLIGLPENSVLNTDNKCCSSFKSKLENVKTPNFNKMEYGVLYFYNHEVPNILVEDIDL